MEKEAPFLQSLAKKCHDQYGHQCDRLTVIFPNKRAGVYFADALAQLYNKPVWSPIILSFEEFVEDQQSKNFADDLQMIFLLYKAYKQIVKHPEDFDAFYPWGEMILKDFNDIDNYLVDVQHIFRVIKSQKELDEAFRELPEEDQKIIQGFWKGFLPSPNKKQSEFIATWSILAELHTQFNQLLDESGLTYKGRMFRAYAENELPTRETESIWFAGFNALTRAEEKIIKAYMDQGQSDIFWDLDTYYYEDEAQESGTFFREYAADDHFKSSITRDVKNQISKAELKVNILSAPFSMGQIKAGAQKIKDLALTTADQSKLLVILTDESLLQSLLNAIPAEVEHVNVTMGWGVSQSRIYIFLSKIIALKDLHQTSPKSGIHLKEVLGLMEFNDLLGIKKESVQAFEAGAIAINKIYHPLEDVRRAFPELKLLLESTTQVNELLDQLIHFIAGLDIKGLREVEQSAIVLIHSTLKRIATALDVHHVQLNLNSFHKLFLKLGTTLKLPLSGDPKQGIQVMGILETRNLSFENVLIIGMNEGHWPKDNSNTSFIPYNIRKAFDLPTVEHQDAMQSYLFYRLLHSAEQLWMSYNNISEFNHNGEPSRYIRQLQYESNLKFEESVLIHPIVAENEPEIVVEKSESVMQKLKEYLISDNDSSKRLSPSALNTYIDCKLKFYFQHIEKIKEPDELKEDMDPSLFGNLLHGAMEHLYKEKEHWEAEEVLTIKEQLDEAVGQSFQEQKITRGVDQTGRQLIAFEVIKQYMLRIIDYDYHHAPFQIIGLEATDYFVDFPIETLSGSAKVGLKGIIDRIDQYGETVRVLDYKSGRDDRKFGQMSELIDGSSTKRNKAVFQLFYYCMLYKDNHPDLKHPIQPGLFNSKDLFDSKFDTVLTQTENRKSKKVTSYADFEEEFKEVLLYLLTDLFNSEVAFTQTEDEKKCSYCTYKQICKKG
ncbi:MAG: PD-(D/E)XK nuclease family protein [Reichenbachiella sp.]|uniref:PD-(D/E)XK nuclease family protein n=1 Tax=Reichenbachiella sp. TaxID=2184521 RepID=UPI00326353F7